MLPWEFRIEEDVAPDCMLMLLQAFKMMWPLGCVYMLPWEFRIQKAASCVPRLPAHAAMGLQEAVALRLCACAAVLRTCTAHSPAPQEPPTPRAEWSVLGGKEGRHTNFA